MISKAEILETAGKVGFRPDVVEKDYVLGWTLAGISAHEELRETWFRAPDIGAQKVLAEQLQLQAFEDVPYIPLGQYFIPTAYQANLTGMLQGSPVFWNIRRS